MSMSVDNVKIEESWKEILKEEFYKPYFGKIKNFLIKEMSEGKIIYPKGSDIFNAFNTTPIDKVKVVILGQDPYHGPGQAHGLCFSVPDWIKQPPSLKNIFKEINDDLWIEIPTTWNLTNWAEQGVFLLNAILTVRAHEAASHHDIWWQEFTDAVIKKISDHNDGVVFLLWWSYAQSKEKIIDTNRHYILKTVHPSPLSAYRGFLWCKHFSKTNEVLESQGKEPINWSV